MQQKMEEMELRAIAFLKDGPLTPDELSSKLGISWSTAQGVFLRLVAKGRVSVTRKGRVNVYFIGSQAPAHPHIPSWAKVRDLDGLSRELVEYFPKKVKAAEMIRKERLLS